MLRAESGSYRPMNLPLRAPMLTFSMNAAQASGGCASGDGGPGASGGGASGGWASGDGGPGRGPTACGMSPDQNSKVYVCVFCVHKYMTITKRYLPHPLCETPFTAE